MAAGDGSCVFSCGAKGESILFKTEATKKLKTVSEQRGDSIGLKVDKNEFYAHKSCYCTYTSKSRNQQKRKSDSPTTETPHKRLKSQMEKFSFQSDCLICGELCKEKDTKHPQRWQLVYHCTTAFADKLNWICYKRQDTWAQDVQLRLSGTIDLQAAGAKYHADCYNKFRKVRTPGYTEQLHLPDALQSVINTMDADREQTFTTTELYCLYTDQTGVLTKKQFISRIRHHFGDQVMVITIPGCESVVGFRHYFSKHLKIIATTGSPIDQVEEVAEIICTEAAELSSGNSDVYDLGDFCKENIIHSTSPTLLRLISRLVSNNKTEKTSMALAQCIQQHITGKSNQTSLGLAMKLHHKHGSSDLIHTLHSYGITSGYEEVLRFRKSVSHFATKNQAGLYKNLGLSTEIGPIFSWADNYDLHIASPNGKKSTHTMVMAFFQHPSGIVNSTVWLKRLKIPRLLRQEARDLHLAQHPLEIQHYEGPSKVLPPSLPAKPLTEEESRMQLLSVEMCQKRDTEWLCHVASDDSPLEWAGFNALRDREMTDLIPKPKTEVVFGPMIDAPPAHPDTVQTTLSYLEECLINFGQQYAHLSVDLQLYQTSCLVQWSNPTRWSRVVLHPGMMHTLMSFLGCIGALMRGSGMEILLAAAFGGLNNIMNGKMWTNALRAYRMLMAVLLQNFFATGDKTFRDLENYLEEARKYPTGRLWVDCLIKPTLLALMFLRAERKGDFLLQQYCLKEMLPYFFAAGHQNYARFMTYYVRMVENLPPGAKADLVAGAHVCRHTHGGTSVPADQYGEQTYIRQGKGPGGLKGISTSPEQVAVWEHSFGVCAHLDMLVDDMYAEGDEDIYEAAKEEQNRRHKEEGKRRRSLDQQDRQKIASALQNNAHPLSDEAEMLYNVSNGQVAPDEVNVHNALNIGRELSTNFSSSMATEFYRPIPRMIKSMDVMKKAVKVHGKDVYDYETLFTRLVLVGQMRDVSLEDLLSYELSPLPLSLMDEYGCLRKGNKSVLMKCLGELATPPPPDPDVVVIDAGQLLYHIYWPANGTVKDLAAGIAARAQRYPTNSQKLVVFDKYASTHSSKDHERSRRGQARELRLTDQTQLSCRENVLHNKNNKQALIGLLCSCQLGDDIHLIGPSNTEVLHDEADISVCSYMLRSVESGASTVRIISDDADIFVLLAYWVGKNEISANIQLEKWDGKILDINRTVEKLGAQKSCQLLALHALSGCDTVSYPFGKGKQTALKLLHQPDSSTRSLPDNSLDVFGDPHARSEQLQLAGREFFLHLYGVPGELTLNSARAKMFKSAKKTPPLKRLPPTEENAKFHVLRAHHQMMLWKSADKVGPPQEALHITEFGWNINGADIMPAVSKMPVAPPALLDVVSCTCSAEGKTCSSQRCSCRLGKLSCTAFCRCEGADECKNPLTRR